VQIRALQHRFVSLQVPLAVTQLVTKLEQVRRLPPSVQLQRGALLKVQKPVEMHISDPEQSEFARHSKIVLPVGALGVGVMAGSGAGVVSPEVSPPLLLVCPPQVLRQLIKDSKAISRNMKAPLGEPNIKLA